MGRLHRPIFFNLWVSLCHQTGLPAQAVGAHAIKRVCRRRLSAPMPSNGLAGTGSGRPCHQTQILICVFHISGFPKLKTGY